MLFTPDRTQLRKMFYAAWNKHQRHEPLSSLESIIVDVIVKHPEYHALLGRADAIDRDFSPASGQSNPFLHMAMHIALIEQRQTDRPPGIRAAYQRVCRQFADVHDAEHRILEQLQFILWEAGQTGKPPDEARYLQRVEALMNAHHD